MQVSEHALLIHRPCVIYVFTMNLCLNPAAFWQKSQCRNLYFFSCPIPLGVVIIDDHPEVSTTEDPQSSTNDDGFTEVVSRKQQKRLQDEEKRKKEEQTTQVGGDIDCSK